MEKNVQGQQVHFEVKAESPDGSVTIVPIYKKRSLVGRGQACDITVNYPDISSIHAAIEITNEKNGEFKIYDLNSMNGTFINSEKLVVGSLSLDKEFLLGNNKFSIRKFNKMDIPAAPLRILDEFPPVQIDIPSNEEVALPESPKEKIIASEKASMVYPLERDPDAEFSEYIFEDQENLYPIFKYHYDKAAVEVLITFGDHIQSVDFIPQKDGVYSLAGSEPQKLEIEYPYLGVKDKVPFIDIKGGIATVNPLNGYDVSSVGQENRMNFHSSFNLLDDEIIRFTNGEIQIFVRKTLSPPEVAAAPVFRRDDDFKKYLLLSLLLYFVVMIPLSLFTVDDELEKEKVPERIATILYKKKIYKIKKKVVAKTKKVPKKEQKSPTKKKPIVKQKPKKVVRVKPKKTSPKSTVTPKSGIKSAKSIKLPKIAKANKGPKTVKVSRVVPNSRKKSASPSKSRPSSSKISNAKSRAKGRVDTYKSLDFKSTVSNLLSKGGSTSRVKIANVANNGGSSGSSSIRNAAVGATTQTAKVSNNVGSLAGVAKGTLDQTKGVSGLVNKKSIYTAGLPFKTVVLGGLDPDVIRQILVENIPKFRTCYENVLSRSSRAFNGIVRLNFIIGASGHVTRAGAMGGTSKLPSKVQGCVVNVLRGIGFPEPAGGGVVEVNQPMNFYPKLK
jgi:hypothetical protein